MSTARTLRLAFALALAGAGVGVVACGDVIGLGDQASLVAAGDTSMCGLPVHPNPTCKDCLIAACCTLMHACAADGACLEESQKPLDCGADAVCAFEIVTSSKASKDESIRDYIGNCASNNCPTQCVVGEAPCVALSTCCRANFSGATPEDKTQLGICLQIVDANDKGTYGPDACAKTLMQDEFGCSAGGGAGGAAGSAGKAGAATGGSGGGLSGEGGGAAVGGGGNSLGGAAGTGAVSGAAGMSGGGGSATSGTAGAASG